MREDWGEKRREKREGGVDYAATFWHALCCPVLLYIYMLFEGCDLPQCSCSCFKHFIYINIYIYIHTFIFLCVLCAFVCVVCVCVRVCVWEERRRGEEEERRRGVVVVGGSWVLFSHG